jgi:hypothetical protein
MSAARRAALAVAILTGLALGIRLVGIDFGVPLWEEGDAHYPGHVELLRKQRGGGAPGGRVGSRLSGDAIQYPSLVPELVALLPEWPAPPAGAELERHLAAASGTFLQVRLVVALLGVLAVPLTYRLARRVAPRGFALLAAAIPAASLLHLCFSQQARPHAAAASLFLAAVLACLRLRRRPTAGAYLAAGTAAALALGCLHSGALLFLPLLAAHGTAERPAGAPQWRNPRLLLALLPIALAVPVFYASALDSELREAKQIFRVENGTVYMANHKLNLEMWNGRGAASLLRILANWEPELLVLLPLALAGWLATRRRAVGPRLARGDAWVLASFAAPYVGLLALYARTYERFLLPILPFAAAFVACGTSRLAAGFAPRPRRAFAAGLVALLALPAWAAAHWAYVRSRPCTLERAGACVRAQAGAADERIYLSPPYDLPLGRADPEPEGDGPRRAQGLSLWSRYQSRLAPEERPQPLYPMRWLLSSAGEDLRDPATLDAYLDERKSGIYVVEVASGARAHPGLRLLSAELARRGELVGRFSPDPDPYFSDHPLADEDEEVSDWPGFFWRSLAAISSGPVVEVYRVR